MGEAEKLWAEHIEPNKEIKAVVFISSKSDNFIAGADIQVPTFFFCLCCARQRLYLTCR